MSVQKITQVRYQCRCDLPDCPGQGRPWISKDDHIPERCNYCGRRTWNGQDKRRNLFLTAQGKTQRLCEWESESGISKQLIRHRLNAGWSEEDAVTIPVGKGK